MLGAKHCPLPSNKPVDANRPPNRLRAKGLELLGAPTVDRAAAFTRWDKNTDGILTLEEYTNGLAKKDDAPKRFQTFDKNSDGKLTREEFVGAK